MPKRKLGSRFTSGHLLMVVSGLLAFLLTMVVLGSRSETITVYVARENMVAGKSVEESQFRLRSIPSSDLDSEYVEAGALKDGNFFTSRSIDAGEPLLVAALTPKSDQTNVRLQSIPIAKNLAVNGNIGRNDLIDIIATPDDPECSYRALRGLKVVAVPGSGGGGVLGSGSDGFAITVQLERAGDDLILAGVIASGKFQVVKSTGSSSGGTIVDPQCGVPPESNGESDTDGA